MFLLAFPRKHRASEHCDERREIGEPVEGLELACVDRFVQLSRLIRGCDRNPRACKKRQRREQSRIALHLLRAVGRDREAGQRDKKSDPVSALVTQEVRIEQQPPQPVQHAKAPHRGSSAWYPLDPDRCRHSLPVRQPAACGERAAHDFLLLISLHQKTRGYELLLMIDARGSPVHAIVATARPCRPWVRAAPALGAARTASRPWSRTRSGSRPAAAGS